MNIWEELQNLILNFKYGWDSFWENILISLRSLYYFYNLLIKLAILPVSFLFISIPYYIFWAVTVINRYWNTFNIFISHDWNNEELKSKFHSDLLSKRMKINYYILLGFDFNYLLHLLSYVHLLICHLLVFLRFISRTLVLIVVFVDPPIYKPLTLLPL